VLGREADPSGLEYSNDVAARSCAAAAKRAFWEVRNFVPKMLRYLADIQMRDLALLASFENPAAKPQSGLRGDRVRVSYLWPAARAVEDRLLDIHVPADDKGETANGGALDHRGGQCGAAEMEAARLRWKRA